MMRSGWTGESEGNAGEPAAQGTAVLASIVRREAYVLAYIDAFWLIAWVSVLGILLVLLLRPPPPNPLIPSRGAS
jgi:DHA2 family multidrug resistance protein